MTIPDWCIFSLKGWQPFAKRSAAKGWFAGGSARVGWHPFQPQAEGMERARAQPSLSAAPRRDATPRQLILTG
ncbi:MAG: hypothetical protein DRP66_02365 [Planctomycetota bacterium]|nr:MAG: hypothetical protein DRP66_02365 [Planctomycetota bacterium]